MAGTYNHSSLIDPQKYGIFVVQQPTSEFLGFIAISTVAVAVLLGFLVQGKLRD